MTTQPRASDWLLIAIPGLIWGASFLFIAQGLDAVGPTGVTAIRLVVGFLTLACFPAAWKPIERRDWRGIALVAVLWMAFPLSMFPFAEQRVSSALTGMLNGGVPLSTAIVASLLARRFPSRGILIGLAVGMAGAVLIAVPALDEGRSSVEGVLMILAAVVSYGIALNFARPLQQKYGGIPVIWRALGVAILITAPLGAGDVMAAHWSPVPILALLALGAGGTAIAFIVMTAAAGRFGATRASSATFLIPPVALLLGVLVRSERVELLSIVGGAICLAGAWLMSRAQHERVTAEVRK
ncbi:MAG: DMT family transporter [Gemmatimonadota bacterium]